MLEKLRIISDKLIEYGSNIGYWLMNIVFRKPILYVSSMFCPKNAWALKLISRTEITHPNIIARDILFALVIRAHEYSFFNDIHDQRQINFSEKEILAVYIWAKVGRSEREAKLSQNCSAWGLKQSKAERKAIDILNAKYCAWIVKNLEAFTLND